MNDKKDQSGFRWNIIDWLRYDEDRYMSHKYESRSPERLDRPPESLDDLIRKIWLLCVICIPIITVSVAFIAYFYLVISGGMNSLAEAFGR